MKDVQQFDRNDPQWNCGCGCHIKTGAKIIAVIFTIATISATIGTITYLSITGLPLCWVLLACCLIMIFVIGCLWNGLVREREGYLIPFMACLVIGLIGCVQAAVTVVPMALQYLPLGDRVPASTRALIISELLGLPVGFALLCWTFVILLKTCNYIKRKNLRPISEVSFTKQTEQVYVSVSNEGPYQSSYKEVPLRSSADKYAA